MSKTLAPAVTSPAEAESAYRAAQTVVEIHRRVADWLRVGVTLPQIDQFVARMLEDLGCRSCFLHYRQGRMPRFPSYACLGVNDCVVHGTAGAYLKPLREGDLLKIDIGIVKNGWIGDAGWTYAIGSVPPEIRRFMDCGKESLRRGVAAMQPGHQLRAWAQEVQNHVEHECGFHLIRGLGGHGYGRSLHAPPYVSNVVPTQPNEWAEAFDLWTPGTLVAVEPMLAMGTSQTRQTPREWPVYTADGSLSVHYEHDVLITESGPRILTEGMERLPDIVG